MTGNGRKIQHWQVMAVVLAVFDAVVLNLSFFLALLLRFDFNVKTIPSDYLTPYLQFTFVYMVSGLFVYGVP